MEYSGKLYGKVDKSYIPLEATTDDFDKIGTKIGKEIKKHCREYITISGHRFDGISWAEVCRILGKYGFIDKIPF